MHKAAGYSVVTLVIGKDWTSGAIFGAADTGTSANGAGATAPSAAVASSSPSTSLLTNAGNDKACMYVPQPEW